MKAIYSYSCKCEINLRIFNDEVLHNKMNATKLNIKSQLFRFWKLLSKKRKIQFVMLFTLMVLTAIAETLSISMVLPFLSILTSNETSIQVQKTNVINAFFVSYKPHDLLVTITVIFGVAALIAASMRLTLAWVTTKLTFSVGSDLSNDVYRKSLSQSYATFIERNSSEIIGAITVKTTTVIHVIKGLLTMMTAIIMVTIVLTGLFLIDPFATIIIFGIFGLVYLGIMISVKKALIVSSFKIAHETTQVVKTIQEGLGCIRDIILDNTQIVYCELYKKIEKSLRDAQSVSIFISQSPRYVLEAIAMLSVAGFTLWIIQNSDSLTTFIPLVGVFVLGAQRLLPILQQGFGGWTELQTGQISFKETLDLIEQPCLETSSNNIPLLEFADRIVFKDVCFKYYENSTLVLKKINFDIKKGEKIGIVGKSGSGKSTLIDLLMGLLKPTSGYILVDDNIISEDNFRSWQKNISHVPQMIFLGDFSISENIAIGTKSESINIEKLKLSADVANISNDIYNMPYKFDTVIGERGIKISGGQRQRIGLARAFYKNSSILVLDEATSALDFETERVIMSNIEKIMPNLTIIHVTHRNETLKVFDKVIEVDENGSVCVKNLRDNYSYV